MDFPLIAARAFNTPLLVEPRKAAAFLQGFGGRIAGAEMRWPDAGSMENEPAARPAAKPFATLIGGELSQRIQREGTGYSVVDGVAVVPLSGVLVHRGAYIGKSSGQMSYEGVTAQINALAEDTSVRAVALEIDSFGGEVAGCFDLADRIRELASVMPVHAFVAEHAFSAAYALASQAHRIIVPRTGGVGSIGVLCMHVDMSGAMEQDGVVVTPIYAGAHKVDGNPYEPLPDDVRDDLKAEMEDLRRLFAETVAAGRGEALDTAAALATEARSFAGAKAVQAGLADEVAEPRAAFLKFVEEINSASPARSKGVPNMAKVKETTAADDETADDDEDDDEDTGGGKKPVATKPVASDERARIASILNAPDASGRDDLAKHLAFNTDLSPEAAVETLKAAPKASNGGGLHAAMDRQPDYDIGPGGDGGDVKGPSAADLMREKFA